MEYPKPLGGGYENIRYVYMFSNGKLDRDPRLGVIYLHTNHMYYLSFSLLWYTYSMKDMIRYVLV